MAGAAGIFRRVRDEHGIGEIQRRQRQTHRPRRQRVGLGVDQAKGRIGGCCFFHFGVIDGARLGPAFLAVN